MHKIAICDNEVKLVAALEETLYSTFENRKIKCEIDIYLTGEEFCEAIESGAHYDLVFLDIKSSEGSHSGIAIGEFIRESCQNHTMSIVYISWSQNYAFQLFKVRPIDFILKPLDNDRIENAIKAYLQLSGYRSRDFVYKKGHCTFKIQAEEIMYLESKDRKFIINLSDGRREEVYGSLKRAYQEQLESSDFIFVNASYVVNFDYVASISYKEVLIEGTPVPISISQRRRKEIRERCFEIVKRRGIR